MKGLRRFLLPPLLGGIALAAGAAAARPEFTHHSTSDWINSEPLTLESLLLQQPAS
jgi:hypothetical protein